MNPPRWRVVIAEDEELGRKRLTRLLGQMGCEVVCSFNNGVGLLEWVRQNPGIDALFLDVQMPGINGMTILKALGAEVPVLMVTAHPEHAANAFDSDAVDYLLKPITAVRLKRALKRLEMRIGTTPPVEAPKSPRRYAVYAGEGVLLIDLAKTTHFEVDNEIVWAHAGQRLRTSWTSLAEVEAAFPLAGMIRIHRHLLIRPEAVVGMRSAPYGRAMVRLAGGIELEASRGGAPRLRELLGLD